MNRAVKIRIYPNKEQRVQIEKTIGCSRFIYNQMLADKISYYQKEKKMLRNTPAGYKKEDPWLKEVDSLAPECIFPEFFSYLGILFFQQPAAGAFIGIDEFTGVRYTQRSLLLFRIFRRSVLFFCIL